MTLFVTLPPFPTKYGFIQVARGVLCVVNISRYLCPSWLSSNRLLDLLPAVLVAFRSCYSCYAYCPTRSSLGLVAIGGDLLRSRVGPRREEVLNDTKGNTAGGVGAEGAEEGGDEDCVDDEVVDDGNTACGCGDEADDDDLFE